MGCASSTPMIATAGSEMLKAATHVADDATKGAESAMQDLGKTVDTAKEAVSTTVAGLGNELSEALKDKTDALDEAKNQLMEKLHLSGKLPAEQPNVEIKAHDAAMPVTHAEEVVDGQHHHADEMMAEERAPTPADSLKTTTPEPEIEEALANAHGDSPPTPKPTLSELEELTTGHGEVQTKRTAVDRYTYSKLSEEKRPQTTEWEKFADSLAQTRKYNPYEALRRGGAIGNFRKFVPPPQLQAPMSHGGGATTTTLPPTQPLPTSVYTPKAYNRVRPEDDSLASDPYYNSCSSSQFESNVSSAGSMRRGALVHRPVAVQQHERHLQREGTNLTVTSWSRSNSTMTNAAPAQQQPAGRKFDYNPARSRIGGSLATSPVHSVKAVGKFQPTNVAARRKSMGTSLTPAQSRQNSILSIKKISGSPIKDLATTNNVRAKLRNTKLPKTPKTPPKTRLRLRRPVSPIKPTITAIKRTLQATTMPAAARTKSSVDLKTSSQRGGLAHTKTPLPPTTNPKRAVTRILSSSRPQTIKTAAPKEEPPVPLETTVGVTKTATPNASPRRAATVEHVANVATPRSPAVSIQRSPAKSIKSTHSASSEVLHISSRSNSPLPQYTATETVATPSPTTRRLVSSTSIKSLDTISMSSLSSDDDSCLVIRTNFSTPSFTDSPIREAVDNTARTLQLDLDLDDENGHVEGNIKLPYSFEKSSYNNKHGEESTDPTTTPSPIHSPSHNSSKHHIEQERCVVCYNQYVIK